MKKLYGIQYLRGAAAMGVVLFHATERVGGAHFGVGAAGVDIFFVISGFIMWVITVERPTTPARFMRERFLRIAPTYWVATGVMVAGGLLGLFPNLVLTFRHVLASLFFLPARSPSSSRIWPVLVQGWTLNYEMFFYAVCALALALPVRARLPFMGIVFGTLVVLRQVSGGEALALHFYGRPVVLEFLAGALTGKLWLAGRLPRGAAAPLFLTGALVAFAAVDIGWLPYDVRILGPSACLLVAGMVGIEAGGRLRFIRPLAYLGDGSYSIYLWHTLAISVVLRASDVLGLPAAARLPLCLAGGTVAGLIAYEIIERPLTVLLKRSSRSTADVRRDARQQSRASHEVRPGSHEVRPESHTS